MNFLMLLSLLVEAGLLTYLEMKAWKTLYTPLNILMLPYVAVLLLTVVLSGKETFNIVDFFYPSIVVWNVGLLLFAIPSLALAYVANKHQWPLHSTVKEETLPRLLFIVSALICLLFAYRFKQALGASREYFGTEDFGVEFCGYGIWGHLRVFTLPLMIACIYYVSRQRWYLWLFIILFAAVNFVYQVKGWVIIPCVSGLCMRFYTGKSHMNMRFILLLLFSIFAIFALSYIVLPLIGESLEMSDELVEFVFGHVFHYLVSGTTGFSVDMQLDYPDQRTFDVIFSPFVNMINVLTGEREMLSPVNPYYVSSGLDMTNVRTFFGTLYTCSNQLQFALYTIGISCLSYLIKISTVRFNNIYIYTIYFFHLGLLAMGWFEFYFFHLADIEFPIIMMGLLMADRMLRQKEKQPILAECV